MGWGRLDREFTDIIANTNISFKLFAFGPRTDPRVLGIINTSSVKPPEEIYFIQEKLKYETKVCRMLNKMPMIYSTGKNPIIKIISTNF